MAPRTNPPAPETPPADDSAERIAALEKDNAALLEQLMQAEQALAEKSERPTLVTTADVAALNTAVAAEARAEVRKPRRIVVSEGVKQDLIRLGVVVEPGTGYLLRLDKETGEVTVIDRVTKQPVNIPVV